MKNFALVFIVVFMATNNVFPNQIEKPIDENSVIWEISRNDIEKKSYLLGTFHGMGNNSIGYAFLDSIPMYRSILYNVDAIATEAEFSEDNLAAIAAKLNEQYFVNYPNYAYIPDSIRCLSDIFENTEEFNFVDSFLHVFKAQSVVRSFNHERLKPNYIAKILHLYNIITSRGKNKEQTLDNFVVMDYGIYGKARELGKHIFAMETLQDQVAAVNWTDSVYTEMLDFKDQAHSLYLYCKNPQYYSQLTETYSNRLQGSYLKGDINAMLKERNDYMQCIYESIPSIYKNAVIDADYKLVTDRNLRWIPVIMSNIHCKSCLIAVGVLHLPGEKGLINLLREEGYILRPVYISKDE